MSEAKTKAASVPKPKYDPNGQFVARTRIHHPKFGFVDPGQLDANDKPFTFDMSHRTALEVEYLVDERKAIATV